MPTKKIPVIVCGGATGRAVIYGYVDKMPEVDKPVKIKNARMVLYWPSECCGLFGLASDGPKDKLRLTNALPEVRETARQVLTVSKNAAKALDGWPTWTA